MTRFTDSDLHEIDAIQQSIANRMHRIPACSGGACQQGRSQCETREACGLPLDADQPWRWVDSLINGARWVFLIVAIFFTLALAAGYVVGRYH
jgi:hypothetical protein